MNWKSTTAVSGITLLATWLGLTSAPQPPAAAVSPAGETRGTPADAAAGSDIEDEARRLQSRMRGEVEYQAPKRNPFRFSARATMPTTAPVAAVPESPVATPPDVLPEWASYRLAGMAIDSVDGQTQRTAILEVGSDVLFAKAGDRIGSYIVTDVDDAGVELTAGDGTSHRLRITP